MSSSVKALVFIHYITNYATNSNCSQYQQVIVVMMVRKAFGNYDKVTTSIPPVYISILDKFALIIFN